VTETQLFILSLIILLLIDLPIVAARSVFLHPSLSRLLSQHYQKKPFADTAVQLLNSFPRLKASFYLSLVIERLLFGGVILIYLAQLSPPISAVIMIGCLVLAAVLLFFLGWIVEDIVNRDPAGWVVRLTPFARVLVMIMSPLVWLPISWFSQTGDQTDGSSLLADELKTLVDAGEQEGVLELGEGKMISSIFDMGNTLAREIMVPRIDILALDIATPIQQAIDAFLGSGHSRVPVYEETIDNIIGLLYAKDLLRLWREGKGDEDLRELLRPAYFIPEAKKVNELLAELQAQRVHMAIVVDEYGGVAGLVTLEDIVEEILGEIQDEFDQAEELPYQQINDDEYVFQGKIDLDEINELLESNLPKDDAATLGGYIYSQLGRVPTAGETVKAGPLLLTVENVSGRRIRKVRVQRITPDQYDQEVLSNVNG
jgi:putative hemolysin